MRQRLFYGFFAFLAVLAAVFAPGVARAWSDIPESESKILTNTARLDMVRVQTKIDGGRNTRMEYAVMMSKNQESWLSIFVNEAYPGSYFRSSDSDPQKSAKMFTIFEQANPSFEREGKSGGVRHIVAKLADRECVVITRHAGTTGSDANSADGTTLMLIMNYCLPKGVTASNDHVTTAVASVGIRGQFDPK